MSRRLKLYFDVSSPYTWVAFESLIKYEKHLGVPLTLVPVSIGFIMQGSGNHGPMAIPAKREHMSRDLDMLSKYWGFRIRTPADFEEAIIRRGTLKPQRLLTAINLQEPGYLRETARALWTRLWCKDEPIHEIEHLRDVCEELAIPNYERLLELSASTPIKEKLKEATDEALNNGAYGLPWIVLNTGGKEDVHLFGSDRLHVICDLLGKDFIGPMRSQI